MNAIVFDARGNLWATEGTYGSSTGGDIVEFSAASLVAATSQAPPTPALTISLGAVPLGITFDAHGNLWVADGNDIDEYSGAPTSASASPIVQLVGAGDASSIAFGPDGTLWFSRGAEDAMNGIESQTFVGPGHIPALFNVYALSTSQITHSGSPAPVSALSIPGPFPVDTGQTDINVSTDVEPYALAFDAAGNLWVQSFQNDPSCTSQIDCGSSADPGGTRSELFEFPATTLHSTGAYVAWNSGAAYPDPGGSTILTNGVSTSGMAFDTAGNLYELAQISNTVSATFTLQIYRPQAFASASPSPAQSLPLYAGYITTGPTYR